tara:strand:- start:800 stop:931 length:132 start_codon:yes stop_codon:yes gene_type:complete
MRGPTHIQKQIKKELEKKLLRKLLLERYAFENAIDKIEKEEKK